MKKFLFLSIVCCLALGLSFGVGFAGNSLPNTPFVKFNIIGKPGAWTCEGKCAESNGKTIMVDLETEKLRISGVTPTICPDDYPEDPVVDDQPGDYKFVSVATMLNKTKIYFNDETNCAGVSGFDIVDRDATAGDLRADICLPTDNGEMIYDVYVRILGKPNKCMDINGFVFWDDSAAPGFKTTGWYWSGSVLLARKGGKSEWVLANDLFDIWWCSEITAGVCTGVEAEISVFSDFFVDYIWQVNNYGTRIVQVRFYEREE